jgi:DHA2 family multidrug resistance protein
MTEIANNGAVHEPHPWLVAGSVMIGTFMVVLDSTVVNVALPHIAGSLSSTVDEATWALTSYLAANAIVLPITGWLSNYFGRKRLLLMSVIGFTTSSFLCGLAPSLVALIMFRIIQGATGGALQPISQAVLLEAFPPAARGKAMGIWGLGIVVAPIMGPVLGGWLTDNYSWRWVFYINVPIGVLAVIMARAYVFDPPYIRRLSEVVDYVGLGLLALAVSSLQVMLDSGRKNDWFESTSITLLLVFAIGGFTLFVVRELLAEHPVVDLRVFANRTYTTGVILTTTLGFVLFGSLVLLPIMLQTLLGYPALQAGIAMAPRGMGSFIGMPLVGAITTKMDARKLVAAGLISGAVTLFWLGDLNLNAGYWDIFWPQFVQGIAMSLLFVPLTTITMAPIPREQMGNAASVFNLMRNIGGSVGIAASSTLLAHRQEVHRLILGEHINAYNPTVQSMVAALRAAFIARGADAVTATQRAYAAINGMVMQQAAMLSFLDAFIALGMVFLIMTPVIFFMRKPEYSEEHVVMAGE